MGARRTARERALQAPYQQEMAAGQPGEALQSAWSAAGAEQPDREAEQFALSLLEGVRDHLDEIDAMIQTHSHHWRIDRMTRIDRNVLRLGIFELKYLVDIPGKVSINEAVELGKRFGTEDSSAFFHGLLVRDSNSFS